MSESSIAKFTRNTVHQWQSLPCNLLQILIALQQAYSHIPAESRRLVADLLHIDPSLIDRNIDFYSFLHHQPAVRFELLFSDNIVDQMLGSGELCEQLARQLGIQIGDTRADGRVRVATTSCTGMGDQGPAALVNGLTLTRLDGDRIRQIAELIESDTPLEQWPQEWFQVQPNIRRRDILLNHKMVAGSAIKKLFEAGAKSGLQELQISGLRGRGGAGFATATKWRLCRETDNPNKVVVCNADEGEPGTFKDRLLLQEYADGVIEGMTLCAAVVGANQGFIYLRGEYRYLVPELERVLATRRSNKLLGKAILGHPQFDFDITIHLGAGAYICGEESALIESLEGKPGIPRIRPPFPVTHGYLGLPTVVNNVETLLAAAVIIDQGSEAFSALGTPASSGTKLLSISGDCARPGIYEYPFGTNIDQILEDCGAQDTQLAQLAGPAGECLASRDFHRCIAFEDLPTGGSFMVFNQSRDILRVIQNFTDFFRHESCGFCTPCRIGTGLLQQFMEKIQHDQGGQSDLDQIAKIGQLMGKTSHCGLGSTAANPLLKGMEKFPAAFQQKLTSAGDDPGFDLQAALKRPVLKKAPV